MPGRSAFLACNYTCQYLLAGLEPNRFQVQVLHEFDSYVRHSFSFALCEHALKLVPLVPRRCCFSPHGRHDMMRAYEFNIRRELLGRESSGWFTVTSNNHTRHEVCAQDKTIIASTLVGRWTPGSDAWDNIECDILHGDGGACAPDVEPGCTNPSDPFHPDC